MPELFFFLYLWIRVEPPLVKLLSCYHVVEALDMDVACITVGVSVSTT